jgi:hypothetical protein
MSCRESKIETRPNTLVPLRRPVFSIGQAIALVPLQRRGFAVIEIPAVIVVIAVIARSGSVFLYSVAG